MLCGGLYLLAIFATMLLFLALRVLGWLERRFNLKPLLMHYSIEAQKSADDLVSEVNSILEEHGKEMQGLRLGRTNGNERLVFTVDGTRSEHRELANRLRRSTDLRNLETTEGLETE